MNDNASVTVTIMEKEYCIVCPANEKEALLKSVGILADRIATAQKRGNVLGAERLVVMAALHIANELIQEHNNEHRHMQLVDEKLQVMHSRIDQVLTQNRELYL